MRLDYSSYVVAVICFLFAGVVLATTFAIVPAYLDVTIGTVMSTVLAILGIILAGVGYSQRPRETISPPSAQVQQAQQVQQVTVQVEASPIATPMPTTTTLPEEPEKPQEETKPEMKPVRKRRKKASP